MTAIFNTKKLNIKKLNIVLFFIFVTLLSLPLKSYAKSNETYKDGIYVYQILNKEDKTVSLIGIEVKDADDTELRIPGTVNINDEWYKVENVDIHYDYYLNDEYSSLYKCIEKINVSEDFRGSIQNLLFAFPNIKTIEFYGRVTPKEVILSVFNNKDTSDISFQVPSGLESAYQDIIQYNMDYYFGSDLYERSIPLTPTIVSSSNECDIEYGFFQKKGVLYKVIDSAKDKTGKVSIIGLSYAFRDNDNSYLSLPEKVEYNGYSYKVTHIAKFGLVGARSKIIKLPHSITSMDSHILDVNVELLFLSKNCKIIPNNLFVDENNESSLRFISVPEGVTTIKANAFNQIPRNTSSIILPTTIKTLENKSLYQFKLVTFLNKKPINNIKAAIKNATTVKVAKTAIKSYQSVLSSKVTVVESKNITKASKISLNKSNLSLKINSSFTLKGSITKGSNETIYFLSSNPEVVTVNSKGVMKGKSQGTAYVVAYTRTSGLITTAKITITR